MNLERGWMKLLPLFTLLPATCVSSYITDSCKLNWYCYSIMVSYSRTCNKMYILFRVSSANALWICFWFVSYYPGTVWSWKIGQKHTIGIEDFLLILRISCVFFFKMDYEAHKCMYKGVSGRCGIFVILNPRMNCDSFLSGCSCGCCSDFQSRDCVFSNFSRLWSSLP